MAGYHSFYQGTNYGLDPNYGKSFDYITPGEFSISTDPRTANQLKSVSEKISSGIKSVEISMLSTDVTKAIPKQNLEEINRLRKLTGVDLTLHGPVVEPTGIGKQGWDPEERELAERELLHTIERAQVLRPEGGLVVTIHSSGGLLPPEVIELKNGKEVVTNIAVVDERTGQVGMLPKPKKEYLEGEKEPSPYDELKEINDNNWRGALSNISMEASRAKQAIDQVSAIYSKGADEEEGKKIMLEDYKRSKENPAKYLDEVKNPVLAEHIRDSVDTLNYGESYLQDAYRNLKEQFNRAYAIAEKDNNKETLEKLNRYKGEMTPKIEALKKDPSSIINLADDISKGINILQSIDSPQVYKPLKEFALDKASETFSNVAFGAYDKFGDKAPILSIENPPVGMGLARGEELRALVEKTREKIASKLQKEKGFSEDSAKREAEKLVGVTWDVGHINMLRKYGYTEKELEEETKKVAPMVNKIHLSDNFGFEHSELPMGMGNVPMSKHLGVLKEAHGEQLKKIKNVIEAGDWYQHFQTTPFEETLQAFGSPLYAMKMGPTWNQYTNPTVGGYFAGYGYNPDYHHSIYGSGFANIPVELGGQMAGKSRMGGAPIE